ncbi:MAG: histidinol-phosphatase HisJ family protein [Ruminococcaceae bacterium]|nr:histidinol-phosphatase HisJ family protein [Oscillospiraceae bacterium]
MPARCSVHTHTTFCDGRNSAAEMAAAAFAAGVKHYGFSGHIHTPCPSDVGICMTADMTDYCAEILRLREAYADRMEILLGIEWDLCSDLPVPDWADYWIGSVHNLRTAADGYCCVDWNAEELARGRDACFGGDMEAMAEAYYAAVAEVAALRPTILGHVDLITKLNAGGRFFDEASKRYRVAALDALHRADPAATVLEINTGAMARGYRHTPYPAQFLLKEWKQMGGRIILTADAHSADGVLYGYEAAAAWAEAAGFDRAVLLTAGGFADCALK